MILPCSGRKFTRPAVKPENIVKSRWKKKGPEAKPLMNKPLGRKNGY